MSIRALNGRTTTKRDRPCRVRNAFERAEARWPASTAVAQIRSRRYGSSECQPDPLLPNHNVCEKVHRQLHSHHHAVLSARSFAVHVADCKWQSWLGDRPPSNPSVEPLLLVSHSALGVQNRSWTQHNLHTRSCAISIFLKAADKPVEKCCRPCSSCMPACRCILPTPSLRRSTSCQEIGHTSQAYSVQYYCTPPCCSSMRTEPLVSSIACT